MQRYVSRQIKTISCKQLQTLLLCYYYIIIMLLLCYYSVIGWYLVFDLLM